MIYNVFIGTLNPTQSINQSLVSFWRIYAVSTMATFFIFLDNSVKNLHVLMIFGT